MPVCPVEILAIPPSAAEALLETLSGPSRFGYEPPYVQLFRDVDKGWRSPKSVPRPRLVRSA